MDDTLAVFEAGLIERLEYQCPHVRIRQLASDIASRGYSNPNGALIKAARNVTPGSRFSAESAAPGACTISDIFASEQAFCDQFNKLRLEAKRDRWSEREFLHNLELLAQDNHDAYIAHRLEPILAGARNAARDEELTHA